MFARSALYALLAAVLLAAVDAGVHRRAIKPSIPNGHWVATWTAMPQLTEVCSARACA
jgi:hypothetical protein